MLTVLSVSLYMITKENKQTWAHTLPRTRPMDTGPYTRESLDRLKLSLLIHICPAGTTTCSDEGAFKPIGSTHTMSPGRPRTRLQTMRDGASGEYSVMTSPRARRSGWRRRERRSSIITAPSRNVGSMEGPYIFSRNGQLDDTDTETKDCDETYEADDAYVRGEQMPHAHCIDSLIRCISLTRIRAEDLDGGSTRTWKTPRRSCLPTRGHVRDRALALAFCRYCRPEVKRRVKTGVMDP